MGGIGGSGGAGGSGFSGSGGSSISVASGGLLATRVVPRYTIFQPRRGPTALLGGHGGNGGGGGGGDGTGKLGHAGGGGGSGAGVIQIYANIIYRVTGSSGIINISGGSGSDCISSSLNRTRRRWRRWRWKRWLGLYRL